MNYKLKILPTLCITAGYICSCPAQQKEWQQPDSRMWHTQSEYKIKLKPAGIESHDCNASLSIAYQQFDQQAQVDASIENNDCPLSEGRYTVRLRINNVNGATQVIEQTEKWRSNDGAPFESQKLYDIGENAELLKVTSRGLTCECITSEQPD